MHVALAPDVLLYPFIEPKGNDKRLRTYDRADMWLHWWLKQVMSQVAEKTSRSARVFMRQARTSIFDYRTVVHVN